MAAPSWAGAVTGTAGIAALAVLVDRGPGWGLRSGPGGALLGASLLLTVLFVGAELRAEEPLVGAVLLRNGRYLTLTAAGAVANAATVALLYVVPASLQVPPWNLPAGTAGAVFLAPACAMAAAGPAAGRIRSPHAVPAMAACLGAGGALLSALPLAAALPVRLSLITVCAAALGLANALTLTATQGVVDPEHAGRASGLTKTVITVAAGLGVLSAGPVAGAGCHVPPAADSALTAAAGGCLTCGLLLCGRLWFHRAAEARCLRGRRGDRR